MHAIWKAAILGATLGGLSLTGAGTALADTPHIAPALSVTTPAPADWPFDDLDDLAHLIPPPFQHHITGYDDDWYGDDDWFDDDWDDD
jgi:hypothetical protein